MTGAILQGYSNKLKLLARGLNKNSITLRIFFLLDENYS
jgi:hypothetical protein